MLLLLQWTRRVRIVITTFSSISLSTSIHLSPTLFFHIHYVSCTLFISPTPHSHIQSFSLSLTFALSLSFTRYLSHSHSVFLSLPISHSYFLPSFTLSQTICISLSHIHSLSSLSVSISPTHFSLFLSSLSHSLSEQLIPLSPM